MSASTWVLVGLVGGVGAILRFLVDGAASQRIRGDFPYGTLAVNLTGAVLLGLITGLALHGRGQVVVGAGLIGAYTTFSTWMLETQRLAEEGEVGLAVANLAISLIAGVLAAALGRAIGS